MKIRCIRCGRDFEQKFNERSCGCWKDATKRDTCPEEFMEDYLFFSFRRKITNKTHNPIYQFFRMHTDEHLTESLKRELIANYA